MIIKMVFPTLAIVYLTPILMEGMTLENFMIVILKWKENLEFIRWQKRFIGVNQ